MIKIKHGKAKNLHQLKKVLLMVKKPLIKIVKSK